MLSDLSEDILAQILIGELSISAMALWMTLNRRMQARLSNKGILDLTLSTLYLRDGVSWPRYFRHFKLRSLRILDFGWDTVFPIGPQLRSGLRELWQGLELLEIRGTDVSSAFELKARPGPSSELSVPTKRPKIAEDAKTEAIDEEWNMNLTHPHLKTLIFGTDQFQYLPFDFGSTAFLPLTHLDIYYTYCRLSADDCLHLPPQLTHLVMPSSWRPHFELPAVLPSSWRPHFELPAVNFDNIDCLPRSITSLKSDFTNGALFELAKPNRTCLPNLAAFPQRTNIENLYHIHRHFGWPGIMNAMDLTCPSFGDDEVEIAAVNQKSDDEGAWKSAGSPEWPTLWRPPFNFVISHLPPTLTSLCTYSIDWNLVQPPAFSWPATLTSIPLTKGQPHSFFHLLPRWLKDLSFRDFGSHSPPYVPGNVVRISLHERLHLGRAALEKADLVVWTSIKSSMLSLALQSTTELIDSESVLKSEIEAYIRHVEMGNLYGLPLSLTALKQCHYYPTNAPLNLLPPLVTSTCIEDCEFDLTHESPLRALPPYLKDLSLAFPRYEMGGLSWQPSTPNDTSTGPISLRNSRLTSLSVHGRRHAFEAIGGHLPRELQSLYIVLPQMPFHAAALRNVPSSVKSLEITGVAKMTPKGDWASLLPRHLTRIKVSAPLEVVFYEKLPPQLEVMCVGPPTNLKFNEAAIDARPSTIYKGRLFDFSQDHFQYEPYESWFQIRSTLLSYKHEKNS